MSIVTTSDQKLLARVATMIEEIADIPASDLDLDKELVNDLEIDSLTLIEIAVAIQDEFDVDVEDEKIKKLKTVGDVVALLKSSGIAA